MTWWKPWTWKKEQRLPERELFDYWDGTQQRKADPLACWRKIYNHETYRHDTHPLLMDEGDQEAIEIVLAMVREVFDVEEWDGESGLTQGETIDLFIDFLEYLDSVKKNTSPIATQPPPTASTSPTSNGQTPSDSSPSTSTATEPMPEGRT